MPTAVAVLIDAGITPEHPKRMHTPFFSAKFMGSGMGFPLVPGILRAHWGVSP